MQKELGKVGKNSIVDYSLSLRFQLEENLWSCKVGDERFLRARSLGKLPYSNGEGSSRAGLFNWSL